ncbi:ATP-binding protein [Aliikangiella sp. IMCC44653]
MLKKSGLVKSFLLVFCLAISSPILSSNYAEIGIPLAEVFDQKTHKGTGQNWWLTEGKNGLIYSGTGNGLTEWDGEKWRYYPTPNKTLIRSLTQWKDGRIYVGTTDDIGFYDHNQQGVLTYQSLLTDWSPEKRSFGQIWAIASNQHGVIFVSRKLVLFWDGKSVKQIQQAAPGIHRIFAVNDGFIYKAKEDPHLYKISPQLNVVKTDWLLPKSAVPRLITLNHQKKLVVITSRDGIFQQSSNSNKLELRVQSSSFDKKVRFYHAIKASDGYYYLATLSHGLFILDKNLQPVKQYTEDHGLGSNKIYSLLEDSQGNIWLSGAPNIVKMVPPHKISQYQSDQKIMLPNKIGLLQQKVAIAAHGLFQLEPAADPLAPAVFKKLTTSYGAKWDFLEYQGHLIHAGEQGIFAQKYDSGKLDEKLQKLGTAFVARDLHIDPVSQRLFAATLDGILLIDYQQGEWRSQKLAELEDEIRILSIDKQGVVWAGTETQELYRIENAQFPNKPPIIKKFTSADGLGANDVVPHYLSSGLVIGSNDGLLDYAADRDPPLKSVANYPALFTKKGNAVRHLYEDHKQRIWYNIGEHSGFIERRENGEWHTNEQIFKSLPKNGYRGVITTGDNIAWFLSTSGNIYRLDVELLASLPAKGWLNIRSVETLDSEQTLITAHSSSTPFQLTQANNSIRISYALAENTNANPAMYRHKLIGSKQEEWSRWLYEQHKDYTELSGADYRFVLQSKDGWGRISTTELPFAVQPPWYLSGLALFVYALILALLLGLSGWITQRLRTKKLAKLNQELEQRVALRTSEVKAKVEQLKQQQILKDRFFSNVSHEFRTPLTLTIMPLQDLLSQKPNLEEEISFPVETALRNSRKMLDLIGQVLDINRLESGQFPLNINQYDIAELVNRVTKRFVPWAEQHQQTICCKNVADPNLVYCDQDQIDKCVGNLISNAIKYSGAGSEIKVQLVEDSASERVGIQVSDNGVGVSQQAEQKIFERFYQEKQSEEISEPGTGIGLSLVKELIALHQGEVELINQPGQGCSFILWLRKGYEHFGEKINTRFHSSNELVIKSEKSYSLPAQLVSSENNNAQSIDQDKEDITTLLIVDDNSELRHFIALRLSSYYRIIQASNGQEGLSRAKSELPDLIISDIMMPIKDGLQMVQELKACPSTSFIPIILLTAKSTKRETVEGIQTGADDYLTKPFDTAELIVRAAGIINSRKKLKRKIKLEIAQAQQSCNQEIPFEVRLRAAIESQITEPEFSIDELARSLALSRRSLSRKCQQELNQSVGKFITQVRMQNAFELIEGTNHSVSEIAYAVGYESLAYFSRAFKKHFGIPPSKANRKALP